MKKKQYSLSLLKDFCYLQNLHTSSRDAFGQTRSDWLYIKSDFINCLVVPKMQKEEFDDGQNKQIITHNIFIRYENFILEELNKSNQLRIEVKNRRNARLSELHRVFSWLIVKNEFQFIQFKTAVGEFAGA